MSRTGAVTFKGKPMTLAGNEVNVGATAPDFTMHRFADGALQKVTRGPERQADDHQRRAVARHAGLPEANQDLQPGSGRFGDKINALTVSLDLPFAMNRFCGAEGITSLKSVSDYQDRSFGHNWGMLIDELKILARGTFVLDEDGKVVYAETVKEVAQEPNYEAALSALKAQL